MKFSFFADNRDPFFRQKRFYFIKFGAISEVLRLKVVNDEKKSKKYFFEKRIKFL